MRKKAVQLSVTTFVEIILFAAITLLIAIPACGRLLGWWVAKPTTGTTKSIDAIRIEVNNLYDRAEIPVFVDENHVIKIFNAGAEERPVFGECKKTDKSCICVCTEPTCSVKDDEVNLCKAFDDDYFDKPYEIPPKLVDGKAHIQNCIFVKDKNKKVSIEDCIRLEK